MWATQHLDERWTLEARLEREGDSLTIAEIRVVPRRRGHVPGAPTHERPGERVPRGGVPANVLREIRTSEIYAELRRRIDGLVDWRDPDQADFVRSVWLADARAEPRHPGRRGRDDRYYAGIAAAYVSLVEDDHSPHPVKDLAEMIGKEVTPNAAAQLVHEARSRGLLTASPPGRAGGHLTARARAILGTEGKG